MACLETVYVWVTRLRENQAVRWPTRVREELWMASLALLVAEVDIRDMSSVRVSCTDATPTRGGAVSGVIHPALSRILYDCGEHKGEYRRLQVTGAQANLTPGREGPGVHRTDPFLATLVQDVAWQTTRSHEFGGTDHINIQEAREAVEELGDRSAALLVAQRSANIIARGLGERPLQLAASQQGATSRHCSVDF